MRTDEGVDVTKMAISCLILILLVGAVVTTWYFSYNTSSIATKNMEEAAESGKAERLYQLSDYTNANDSSIAVPSVANALDEFRDGELIYILVETPNGNTTYRTLYTYSDYNSTDFQFNSANTIDKVYQVDNPIGEACRLLLKYSANDCKIRVSEIDTKTGYMIGVTILIL